MTPTFMGVFLPTNGLLVVLVQSWPLSGISKSFLSLVLVVSTFLGPVCIRFQPHSDAWRYFCAITAVSRKCIIQLQSCTFSFCTPLQPAGKFLQNPMALRSRNSTENISGDALETANIGAALKIARRQVDAYHFRTKSSCVERDFTSYSKNRDSIF